MNIPFVDLSEQYSNIENEIKSAVNEVFISKKFISGPYVNKFELEFSKYTNSSFCIGVGNGTDALFLAMKALNIGQGHEVIVPANTFIATSEAVTLNGAKIVFVDCKPDTYIIDLKKVESQITQLTRAIIPVHLYGHPAEMTELTKLVQKKDIYIIQDCAQAHGAKINENHLSDFGDVQCYSFYPGKNLGAFGDAGAITTNNEYLANKIRMLANHGREQKYSHEFEGTNSRMDGIQAAILSVKLKYLNDWNKKRQKNAELYSKLLCDITEVNLPKILPGFNHVFHLFVIRTSKRTELQSYLAENNVQTGIHYPKALPFLKAYDYLKHKPDDFPIAYKYQNEILSLPMFPELSEEKINYVSELIHKFFK